MGSIKSADVADVAVICRVVDLTNGLAARYTCDGNVNDSIGSANGTPSSSFTYTTDRSGNSNSACSFNGVDAKVVTSSITVAGGTGFSIAFWAKTSLSSFTGGILGSSLFRMVEQISFTVIPGSTNSTTTTLPQNTWTHIVGTYDNATLLIKIYKDGVLSSEVLKGNTVGSFSTSLELGQSAYPAYWTGALDDVRYYGRALSASEVQQLYDYQTQANLKTFVTTSVFDGNLIAAEGTNKATGIAAADSLCMKDAGYPGTGIYKAFLVDGANRIASTTANAGDGQINWVLRPSENYYRSDGTTKIMTTNANGIFVFGTLSNPFVAAGMPSYWTGMDADWTTYPNAGGYNQNCAGWSYNTSEAAPFGTFATGNQTGTQAIHSSYNAYCSHKDYHLACFEQ